MTYGANYWSNPYHADMERQRERDAKTKQADDKAWDMAVANLEARMRYNDDHEG